MESEQDIADVYEEWDEGGRPSMAAVSWCGVVWCGLSRGARDLNGCVGAFAVQGRATKQATAAMSMGGGAAAGGGTGVSKPFLIPFTHDAPTFESAGRHLLYCGTDLPVDDAHVTVHHSAASGNHAHLRGKGSGSLSGSLPLGSESTRACSRLGQAGGRVLFPARLPGPASRAPAAAIHPWTSSNLLCTSAAGSYTPHICRNSVSP